MGLGRETERNLFHMALGLSIAALLWAGMIDVWMLIAVALLGFLASLARKKRPIPVLDLFLSRFEREDAMQNFPGRGAFFLVIGSILAVAVFPKDVALASIMILAIGDSVSPIVGLRHGSIKHPLSGSRMVEGAVAGFIAAFLGAMLFVAPHEALIASAVAMTFEAVDTLAGFRVEDNVTIPLVAGLVVMALRVVL